MNSLDKRILSILQENATLPVAEIADQVGLSTSPCWRRIQNLDKRGVIRKRVALVDRDALNLGVDVFVGIKTRHHTAGFLQASAAADAHFPEVVWLCCLSGPP